MKNLSDVGKLQNLKNGQMGPAYVKWQCLCAYVGVKCALLLGQTGEPPSRPGCLDVRCINPGVSAHHRLTGPDLNQSDHEWSSPLSTNNREKP